MSGLYIKLAANFFSDNRIIECSPMAQLIYLRGLCMVKSIETDGRFTFAQMRRECGDIDELPGLLAELVKWDLISEDGQGYTITSWLKHNNSQEWIADFRAKRAEDGRRGGRPRSSTKDSSESEKSQSESKRESQSERQSKHPLGNPKGDPFSTSSTSDFSSEILLDEAKVLIGRRVVKARGQGHKSRGYLLRIGDEDFGSELSALHEKKPGLNAEQLADEVAPEEPAFGAGEMGHTGPRKYGPEGDTSVPSRYWQGVENGDRSIWNDCPENQAEKPKWQQEVAI